MSDPNTVRVRIAVAVDPEGDWQAEGASWRADYDVMESVEHLLENGHARYWLTAELPIPTVPEVAAHVVECGPTGPAGVCGPPGVPVPEDVQRRIEGLLAQDRAKR